MQPDVHERNDKRVEQDTYDPHKTDTEIRQGNKRKMNLRVLLLSGTMILVAFAALYMIFYAAEN